MKGTNRAILHEGNTVQCPVGKIGHCFADYAAITTLQAASHSHYQTPEGPEALIVICLVMLIRIVIALGLLRGLSSVTDCIRSAQ